MGSWGKFSGLARASLPRRFGGLLRVLFVGMTEMTSRVCQGLQFSSADATFVEVFWINITPDFAAEPEKVNELEGSELGEGDFFPHKFEFWESPHHGLPEPAALHKTDSHQFLPQFPKSLFCEESAPKFLQLLFVSPPPKHPSLTLIVQLLVAEEFPHQSALLGVVFRVLRDTLHDLLVVGVEATGVVKHKTYIAIELLCGTVLVSMQFDADCLQVHGPLHHSPVVLQLQQVCIYWPAKEEAEIVHLQLLP